MSTPPIFNFNKTKPAPAASASVNSLSGLQVPLGTSKCEDRKCFHLIFYLFGQFLSVVDNISVAKLLQAASLQNQHGQPLILQPAAAVQGAIIV